MSLLAAAQPAPASSYHIDIDTTLRAAVVRATLPRHTTLLYMDSVQAEHLPRGWATFVRNLRVRAAGRDVAVEPLTGAKWRIGPQSAEIDLAYSIDLGFARDRWPAGNEQAAASFGDALYIVGRALFVVSNASTGAAVDFELPSSWQVSTPLRAADANRRRFIADSIPELFRNPLVVGRHVRVRLARGPLDLELALPGQPANVAPIVEPALRQVLDAYSRLFPHTPRARYLMSFFRSSVDDGEGFLNGASFTSSDSVTPNGIIVWGNFLAHELMHFWNGQRIHGAPPRSSWRWVAEGFTEYYANITLVREGVISPELFFKKAERHVGNYLYFATAPALQRMSLVEAGTNTSANRFGVYDGGWVAALCLDGLIREASRDRRSLDNFMHELWLRFGPGKPGYTTASLDSTANDVAGQNLSGVLRRYAESREPIPVASCLARFGIDAATKGYAAEAFLFPTPAFGERRRSWLSPSR
jgi:predicted metalloprotease with PDZ domain